MKPSASVLVASAALSAGVAAQNATSNSTAPTRCPDAVPDTVDKAAASGSAGALWRLNADGTYANVPDQDFTYLYTVQLSGQSGLYLAAPPDVPLPGGAWSICSMQLRLTARAIGAGQSDAGDCRETLTKGCADALTVAAISGVLVGGAGGPARSCGNAAAAVRDAVRSNDACRGTWASGDDPVGQVTVTPDESAGGANRTANCYVTSNATKAGYRTFELPTDTSADGRPLGLLYNQDGGNAYFDQSFRTVRGVVTVYVPNNQSDPKPVTGGRLFGATNCVRITAWNAAVHTPSALPAPSGSAATPRAFDVPRGSVMASALVVAIVTAGTLAAHVFW